MFNVIKFIKNLKKPKEKTPEIPKELLYIKGILAYLNQVKKVSTSFQLKNAIRIANNIYNLNGYFEINKDLEIVFNEN